MWEHYTHAQWYSGKHSRSGSRTEDKGEICDGMHWKQDLPQLSTASLCSVSEACCATVLFSWLRSFDMTSRNAMLCTSFWRGSGKRNSKRNSALYEVGKRTEKRGEREKLFYWTPYTQRHTSVSVPIIFVGLVLRMERKLQGQGHAQTPWISGRDEWRSCCTEVNICLPKQMLRKYSWWKCSFDLFL